MHDEILRKLQSRVGRRGFLQGSGLAVAALAGLTVGVPASSYAQNSQQDEKKQGDKQRDDPPKGDRQQDDAKEEKRDEKKQDDAANDPYKVTHVDANGREYRLCPVCGSNMFYQDRTWTCENCGYSYEE
jgi:ribosomal protein S27AE